MRTIMLFALIVTVTGAKAQTFLPGSFIDNSYRGSFANNIHDSSSAKKWSFTRYTAISSSLMFYKGGSAAIFSVPIGLQLNRRLNNNLYAFASVSLEPAYINFNRTFIANDFNKGNPNNILYRPGNLDLYSRAQLGLQYTNDERTFSISGSIGVERSSYPFPQYNQNNARTNHVMPVNK